MTVSLSNLERPIVQNPQQGYSPGLLGRLAFRISPIGFCTFIGGGAYAVLNTSSPIVSSIVKAGLTSAASVIFENWLESKDDLRAAIFIGSEHLSKKGIQGASVTMILPPVISALKKLDFPNASVALNLFENILNDETYSNHAGIFTNDVAVSHRQEIIRKLKPGEFTCCFAPSPQHAMCASFHRRHDGKFLVRIHNGGEGVENHYFIDGDSGRYYQTTYEIDEVEESKVLEFIKELAKFRKWGFGKKTEDLYKKLIPMLDGIKLDRNLDPRLWSPPQIGGSCSGYSFYCLIKSILTASEFEQFEAAFLNESAESLDEGLNSSWRFWKQTPYHAQALKEIRIRLLKYGKTKAPFPEIPDPNRSLLSRVYGKVMLAGSLIKEPLIALETCLFGRPSNKKHKVEWLKIFSLLLLNPRLFQLASTNEMVMLIIKLAGTLNGNDIRIELEGINFKELCKDLESLPPNWKDSDKKKWTENFELFLREASPEEQDGKLRISSRSLAKLLIAAYDGGDNNGSEIGSKISSALTFFKEKNYVEAFHNLRSAYRLIDQVPETLSREELSGCMSALQELVQWAAESLVPESTEAKNHEEIEFYFANTVLFNKIAKKIGDDPNLRSVFVSEVFGFQIVNETWQKEYERYGRYGLSRYFSRGPWHKDLAQIERVFKENESRLHQIINDYS